MGCAPGDRLVDPGPASEEPGRRQPGRAGRLQKKRAETLAEEEARRPGRPVALFCTDEHRIGLKPVGRRVWGPRGQRPIALGHHRYEWLYVTAFVAPVTGESHWYVGNGVSKPLFEGLLAAFAREAGAGPQRAVILLLDGAGWHTESGLRIPEGLRLVYLPPYTPELQPAERLWRLVDEPIVNRHFDTLAEIQDRVEQRCRRLEAQPDTLRANTLFHWWPQKPKPN
ncbi:IS630 family transposase [Methylobacterium haplocladii]|uniref:IS630 family transposase n=1 Tax=Methylobacterium haplocladii TaxID=1176176 RepID=UPI0024E158EB|nr:IS630 family transposase [Methylobacterium haplocladii]